MSKVYELQKSPLFNISKCSKELAHSNFWAWLIELEEDNKNPFVEVFIPNFYKERNELLSVDREKGKRDLTIWYKDRNKNRKCVVIENKIKSIPTKEQLIGYEETLNKNKKNVFSKGILTGIKPTLDLTCLTNWSYLSYSDIVKRMSKINNAINKKNTYEYMTIEQYHMDVVNLTNIINKELDKTEGKYTQSNNKLAELKFKDVFLKFKADDFTIYLNKKISKNKKLRSKLWGYPQTDYSFNNGKSTITCVYKESFKDNELGRIGVQIEGNQFRIYSGTSIKFLDIEECKKYFEKLKKLGWYEEFKKGGTIRNKATSMKGGRGKEKLPFNKYRSDKDKKYAHIYQYWDIVEDPVSYKVLYKEIEKELLKAKMLIDKKQISYSK